MYLFIHAGEREKTYLLLVKKGSAIGRVRPKFKQGKTADLLKPVHALLEKNNVLPNRLKGIAVLSGPGQFSFLRSGIIIANTFAWALGIPVVGVYGDELLTEQEFVGVGMKELSKAKKEFVPVVPLYGREPNITKAKKKV